tara:strand:- start:992 stop:1681 length:690 start_codon:yes stop_codon:yes gene_type:complete
MMEIHLISPFDSISKSYLNQSMMRIAEEKGLVNFSFYNLFDYADPPHNRIDDYPFGGGHGMILKPEPIFRAVETIQNENDSIDKIIFPSPDGKLFHQKDAEKLVSSKKIIFICGHYKGVDQRVRDKLVTNEYSIGDYVLTGGDLPALVIIDALVRLIPGVLNTIESAEDDSHSNPLLDYPHYTRPEKYKGLKVPEILLSGHHGKIKEWRQKKRLEKTSVRRPDMIKEKN